MTSPVLVILDGCRTKQSAGLWLIPDVGPWLGVDLVGGGIPAWIQRRSQGVAGLVEPGHASAAGLLPLELLISQ